MSTLSTFSEKEREYHQYQARQEYLREQRTIQMELEQATRELMLAKRREAVALKEKSAAQKERQAAQQREEAALAEIEKLKALLAQSQKSG